MKRTFFLIFILIISGISEVCISVPKEKNTLKILFVGNSYTYYGNLPHIVSLISYNTNTKLITKKSVAGSASLSDHWRGERGLKTREIIEKGDFDIVVLQDHSLAAINQPDTLQKYVKLLCDLIRKNKAKPYLYVTWAREKDPQNQEIINRVYEEAAAKNGAEAVPVGKAWAMARELKPEFALFDTDGSHPSKLGTFLTACVFAEVFLQQLPRELPSVYNINDSEAESVMLMYIDPEDAAFCRKLAVQVIYPR